MPLWRRPEGWLDAVASVGRDTWLVVLVWFVFVFPLFLLRGYHYEEGLAVAIARGALQGHWIEPNVYGMRFVERPNLLGDVIGVLAAIFGGVKPWLARIPTLLALLAGALLVKRLVQTQASRAAGTFGALAFLINPMILQKTVTAEPDLPLTVLLFAAFVVWWAGEERGGPSWPRWTAVGLLLAVAALVKGPQPVGYFAFGVGGYLLLYRRWAQIPGFVFAGLIAAAPVFAWYVAIYRGGDAAEWARYLRMNEDPGTGALVRDKIAFTVTVLLNMLPAGLLLPWVIGWLRGQDPASPQRRLAVALACYAALCSIVLFLWPAHLATRYAMPALPAFMAFIALAFDSLKLHRVWQTRIVVVLAAAVALYPIGAGWVVAPMSLPYLSGRSYQAAQEITAIIAREPHPLYRVGLETNNISGHLEVEIHAMARPEEIAAVTLPVFVIGRAETIAAIAAAKPGSRLEPIATFKDDGEFDLARLVAP